MPMGASRSSGSSEATISASGGSSGVGWSGLEPGLRVRSGLESRLLMRLLRVSETLRGFQASETWSSTETFKTKELRVLLNFLASSKILAVIEALETTEILTALSFLKTKEVLAGSETFKTVKILSISNFNLTNKILSDLETLQGVKVLSILNFFLSSKLSAGFDLF